MAELDPDSGYRRRNVSPAGVPHPMHIVEVHFPGRARVTFENARDDADCLAMRLDAPTTFHDPRRKAARYAVVIAA